MVNQTIAPIRTKYWFLLFILIHMTAWTLAPSWVRFNLPMDSIEGAIWGRQLEWGYDKNPFMNGWLTELAVYLGGQSGWTIYLFSQISVGLCFWAIWKLGREMMPPIYALLAVLLLEGIQYYNFHAIDFNDNTLELGLWALTTLFFYYALSKKNNLLSWILTGIFAALGMMTKYYTALLLFSMFLLLLYSAENRQHFKKWPIYCGGLIFLIIITPHIIWLFQHDFVTLGYAIDRVTSPPSWHNHVFYPMQFIWQEFETLVPTIILLGIALLGKKPIFNHPRMMVRSFDKAFLLFIAIGPLLLTVILSAVMGMKLRAGWGQPLFSLWGIIFILLVQPHITPAKFYRFMGILFFLMGLSIVFYSRALIQAPEPSSANFPGKVIATDITQTWHNKFHRSLHYVAGTRWIAGNIAFYSHDRPSTYIDWNKKFSPWINEADMKQEGAVFVWDLSDGKTVPPADIMARFPGLSAVQTQHYAWMRNKDMPPVEILVAYLAPATMHRIITHANSESH